MMIRKYFLAGILSLLPIFLTAYITYRVVFYILLVIGLFIPSEYLIYKTNSLFLNWLLQFLGYGLSVFLAFTLITIVGLFTVNYFGSLLLSLVEKIIAKIPLTRTIYTTIKQIIEVFISQKESPYKQVVIVEYPRKDIYSIGFVTNRSIVLNGENYISVFIPTSPNPTSGFLIVCKECQVINSSLSVEEAAKLIVSCGAINPAP